MTVRWLYTSETRTRVLTHAQARALIDVWSDALTERTRERGEIAFHWDFADRPILVGKAVA